MIVFILHPFFIRWSEQKYWIQRNGNFWYIKPRSDSYKSKYRNIYIYRIYYIYIDIDR